MRSVSIVATSKSTTSVVIPCLNEKDWIVPLLEALTNQDVSGFEVIVADGGSDDGTKDLVRDYAEEHPDFLLRVVENPFRSTPAGLNRAIQVASGEIIIRLDGHSRPAPDYVNRCREVLLKSGADVVGGAWRIMPGRTGSVAGAIAIGVGSVFGAGNALYRIGCGVQARDTDTVPFGCFRKETWHKLGGYNERLLSNEDYEFNLRARNLGGRVHFDPSISCEYVARPTLLSLTKQYWRYGWWKAQMLKTYPGSLKLRQAIPPLWVLTCLCVPLLGLIRSDLAITSLAIWLCYILAVCLFSARLAGSHGWRFFLSLLAVFPTIHFSWGIAFWFGFVGIPRRINELKRRMN